MTIADLKTFIAVYMGRTTSSDLVLNSLDTALIALNAARRYLERAHDFKYAEANVFLSIPATGGSLTACYTNTAVTISGTLSPNVAGSFALGGTYNGLPFYTRTVSGTDYFLSYSGTAWTITPGGFTVGATNKWTWTTADTDPAGVGNSYTPTTYTGTATAAATTSTIGVKRVTSVQLPVASSGYQPIEFMTEDEWVARLRRQIGRQPYNASLTLTQLGVTANMNPVCYQQGQALFLDPSPGTTIAQLNVTRWMPDYVTSNTDFFTDYAPEALQWRAILECNKFWRRFVPKQTENVDEAEVQKLADDALQSLIAWDISTARGTSTPEAQAPKAT